MSQFTYFPITICNAVKTMGAPQSLYLIYQVIFNKATNPHVSWNVGYSSVFLTEQKG